MDFPGTELQRYDDLSGAHSWVADGTDANELVRTPRREEDDWD